MECYPQETIGTTLVDVTIMDERRRVFTQQRDEYLEVGEFTCGPLTQAVYDAPTHYHCVHLGEEAARALPPEEFFKVEGKYLADYMDALDDKGISYGYLNSMTGKQVSYRPESA